MDIRHYLVLGTMHIALRTAQLLDIWASLEPGSRPLAVASTDYGWFVATREPDAEAGTHIPADLLAAMALGRNRGCDLLLLDSDAPAVADLTIHPW